MKIALYTILLFAILGLYSCNKKLTTDRLSSGVWKVSEITEHGQHTKFNSIVCLLKFKYNNTVTATINKVTYKGTWSTDTGDYTDDEPLKNSFAIDFPNKVVALHFNGSYKIPDQSHDKILLEGNIGSCGIPANLLLKKLN